MRYSWHINWLLARANWPYVMAIALFFCAAGIMLIGLPKSRLQVGILNSRLAVLDRQLDSAVTRAMGNTALELRSQLPGVDHLNNIAGDVQALIVQNSVYLTDASYKPLDTLANGQIGRVEIDMRLKGAYPQVKKVLASLLASHEGLSLDSLSIRRNRSTDAIQEIELRLSLYYKTQA
ncbi:MAG: GspMb/PilO family protein [Pseudomonadota bacterium]